MQAISLQALKWERDGELSPNDRFVLLNSLMPQCIPEVQVEFIALMERTPLALVTPTSS